jgi:hypothetical protein
MEESSRVDKLAAATKLLYPEQRALYKRERAEER